MGQVEVRKLDELPFRADALKEHDQLELEEDHRIDRGPATLGIELSRPRTDEAEIELRLQVAVEMVAGNEVLQRDGDRLVEAAGFGWTEHRGIRGEGYVARMVALPL